MERLTVNKPVSEMNMVELAHNCCYISEDGNARYRDYKSDIDAREFTRRLMRIYEGEDLSEGDTEFDEEIMTELKYDPEIYASALIALFYRNMWAMAELRSRLKYYEDAEEQGLLLRLPCKVGDTLYVISRNEVIPVTVTWFIYNQYGIGICAKNEEHWGYGEITLYQNRKCVEWYKTKEEAEKKLAEMKGE